MKWIKCILLLTALLALNGCGGGGGGISGEVDPPPTVTITISPTSRSLEVGDTLQFSSEVNRSNFAVQWYVNDIAGGNATVGTITSTGLYRAPATVPTPATVTVKGVPEADPSKSATARIDISAKLTLSPAIAVIPGGQTQQFTANKAVSWYVNDVSGGNATVGTITSGGLYTAPASVPSPNTVTVKAAWQADSSKTATARITVTEPSSVRLSPTAITLAAGATQQFDANTAVDWQLSGVEGDDRPLGTIDSSGLYTAPSAPPLSGTVTVTAVSKADPTQKAIAYVTVTYSNASLQGHYVLRLRGSSGSSPYFATGSFSADGIGGISNAVFDFNDLALPVANTPFTASYSIGADGRGALNIVYGSDQIEWRFVMISADSARLTAFGDGDSGSGSLERQDPASFSAGLSGPFVFCYDGVTPGNKPLVAAGMFTAGGSGSFTNGIQDFNDNGVSPANATILTGTYGPVNTTTGRGVMSITIDTQTTEYAYYMISAEAFIFSSTSAGKGMIGLALRQSAGPFSNASLIGNSVMTFTGGNPATAPTLAFGLGRFTSNGNGVLSNGLQDVDSFGGTRSNSTFTGSYTISSNGRGTASVVRSGATDYLVMYMIAPRRAFFIAKDFYLASSGQINPQIGLPFNTSSIGGSFGFSLRGTQLGLSTDISGQLTIDGNTGTLSGLADMEKAGTPTEAVAVTGTFTIGSDGRGEASLNLGTTTSRLGMYLLDSDNIYLIETDPTVAAKIGMMNKQF